MSSAIIIILELRGLERPSILQLNNISAGAMLGENSRSVPPKQAVYIIMGFSLPAMDVCAEAG